MRWMAMSLLLLNSSLVNGEPIIIPHGSLMPHDNGHNKLIGIATPSLGAHHTEAWHSSIAVGAQTPSHTHAAEEIVILQTGTLEAIVGSKSSSCSAPCTIILPAGAAHKLRNIGSVATSHYLIMPSKSKIFDSDGNEMNLPWRN